MRVYAFRVCPLVDPAEAASQLESITRELAARGATIRRGTNNVQVVVGRTSYVFMAGDQCARLIVTGHRSWDMAYHGARSFLGDAFNVDKDQTMQAYLNAIPWVLGAVSVVAVITLVFSVLMSRKG